LKNRAWPSWPKLALERRVKSQRSLGNCKEKASRLSGLQHQQGELSVSSDLGSNANLRRWLATDDPAWFLLGPVDELRLTGNKHIGRAIRIGSKAPVDAAQTASGKKP
jgi:hypothetical protein